MQHDTLVSLFHVLTDRTIKADCATRVCKMSDELKTFTHRPVFVSKLCRNK